MNNEGENGFTIKTSVYEGPFDLLLNLIERRKLLINDISLSQVTDEYIRYINESSEYDTEEISQFVVVAATLLFIKSRSLLPIPLEVSEEEDVEELKRRISLYDIFRDRAKKLSFMYGKNILYGIGESPTPLIVFAPGPLSLEALTEALDRVLKGAPADTERLSDVAVRKIVSLEDTIDSLAKRIEKTFRLSFKDFVGEKAERVDVIVSFLAILELVKRGILDVTQHNDFEDLQLTKNSVSTPQYG